MDDLCDDIRDCMDILDKSVDILKDIKYDREDADEITPNLQMHQLYDMAEDLSESHRLKRAESQFMQRQNDDHL